MKSTLFLVLSVIGAFTSCTFAQSNSQISENNEKWEKPALRGSGAIHKVVRKVEGFTGIMSEVNADIFLTVGACSFEVTGQDNLTAALKTEVKNNVLHIWFDENVKIDYNKILKIKISAPAFESLSVAGSGSTTLNDKLASESFNLTMSGSGTVRIPKLSVQQFTSTLSGSGKFILGGTAETMHLTLSGSGIIETNLVTAGDVNAIISGSGQIFCKPSGDLNATISGSGNIRYRGKPRNVQTAINGSGTVEVE
jgi:Putative auto-transporter adhesin, head GIN domain